MTYSVLFFSDELNCANPAVEFFPILNFRTLDIVGEPDARLIAN